MNTIPQINSMTKNNYRQVQFKGIDIEKAQQSLLDAQEKMEELDSKFGGNKKPLKIILPLIASVAVGLAAFAILKKFKGGFDANLAEYWIKFRDLIKKPIAQTRQQIIEKHGLKDFITSSVERADEYMQSARESIGTEGILENAANLLIKKPSEFLQTWRSTMRKAGQEIESLVGNSEVPQELIKKGKDLIKDTTRFGNIFETVHKKVDKITTAIAAGIAAIPVLTKTVNSGILDTIFPKKQEDSPEFRSKLNNLEELVKG